METSTSWSTATHSCGNVKCGPEPHFLRVFFPALRQQRTPQVELPMPSTVSVTSNRMMSEHYFDPRGIFGCADGPSPHPFCPGYSFHARFRHRGNQGIQGFEPVLCSLGISLKCGARRDIKQLIALAVDMFTIKT